MTQKLSATCRRWHRRAGILLAPFLLIQALSGLILTYGVYTRVASELREEALPLAKSAWQLLVTKAHFGPGLVGWIYHSLIGIGLIWMIASGGWIWLDLWRKRRQAKENG